MTTETLYQVAQTDLYEIELGNDKSICVRVFADGDTRLYNENIEAILKLHLSKNGWPAGFDVKHHYFYATRKPSLLADGDHYFEFEPIMVVPFTAPTVKTPAVKKKSKPTKQHNRISIKEEI